MSESLISDATAQAFSSHMAKLGLDPGPTLKAHGWDPPTPAAPSDPAAATEAPPSINSTTSPSGITAAQADATYQYLLGQGVPEADIVKALSEEGYQHVEVGPETPTNDAFQAGSAQDYVREISGAYLNSDVADLPGLDRAIRDTLARIEMPLMQSRAFVENIMAASRSGWASMSDAAKQTRSLEEVAGACRAMGVDRSELMRLGRIAMDRVPRPFAQDMARQGITENRSFLVSLAQAGQRIEAKKK